ncbi:hypothetical protein SAMN02982990_03993 [Photorhabdus luminescens]|uniref:Uncharacterized protein n=1 Tax=Photorhabdus luminescens TaxID=29488 RepID=A0A1G5RG08_PHOLU|nr:hypothetical protein SAMN02982990_03993 [Photorhabdus luminescens]
MNAAIRRYMRAMGSVIDIMPSTDYRKLVPVSYDRQRLRSDMLNISRDMNNSIITVGESVNVQKLRKASEQSRRK